jgi:hypothetical protein
VFLFRLFLGGGGLGAYIKQVVSVRIHLRDGDQLKLEGC